MEISDAVEQRLLCITFRVHPTRQAFRANGLWIKVEPLRKPEHATGVDDAKTVLEDAAEAFLKFRAFAEDEAASGGP